MGHKLALFALILAGLLAAQWAVSIDRERRILMEEAQGRAQVLVRAMAELSREPIASGRLGSLDQYIRFFMGERDASYAMILDHRSRVLAASDETIVGWSFSGMPTEEGFRWTDRALIAQAPIRVPGVGDGYAELALFRAPLDEKIRNSVTLLERFLVAELALSGFFLGLLYRQMLVPVRALVARLGEARPEAGYERIKLPSMSAPEVTRIARAVDDLRQRAAEYQSELVAEERLATIGRMAADVAHEIRNPLEAISGAAEILSGGADGDNEFARVIREEVRNLNEYLTGVLEFARKNGGAPERTDLADLAREAASLAGPLAREAKVAIALDLEACPCIAGRTAIKRAALNLILNAIEASDPDATVDVTTRRSDGALRLLVRDHGNGLAPSARERLFEPYFTTKVHGTGLGLALARQVAEDHGGTLTVKPAEGNRGVLACITLPERRE